MSNPRYMDLETMPDPNALGLAITLGLSTLGLTTMPPKAP